MDEIIMTKETATILIEVLATRAEQLEAAVEELITRVEKLEADAKSEIN